MSTSQQTRVCVNGKLHDEYQYLDLLQKIIETGHKRQTRNAITYSIFGEKLEYDLSESFPILTTKRVFLRGVFEELKFFLLGKTDSKWLEERAVNIWKPNTTREFLDSVGLNHYREGTMGPMYFYNVFHYGHPYEGPDADYTNKGFDQFEYVMNLLKTDPYSRRIIMTTYNPLVAREGVLFPCHGLTIQFYVSETVNDNKTVYSLSCSMLQRSIDHACGLPFNLSSYSLLVYIICEFLNNDSTYTGLRFVPGKLIMFLNDLHLYEEHLNQSKEQLKRTPFPFPKLQFKKKFSKIEELEFDDIELVNYQCHPTIKYQMIA
jgi:thymidylate synthase